MEMEGLTMAQFTRRHVLAGAAGLALIGTNRAKAEDLPPHEKELYEPAKREGELTWYSGQLSAETSEAVGRAFTERFPGVKVNVVRSTSQVAFQRLSQDMRAGAPQCDVFASTDFGHYSFLKRQNALLQFRPRNADGLLDSVKTADPDNYYQTAYLGIYLLAYNTQKVAEADAPKAWQDVLDPRWKDQLAVGHPGYSGAIGLWAVQLRKMYSWDYFAKLEHNRPLIGRSSEDPITALNAGERAIGLAVPIGSTLLSVSRGNPLKIVYPTDGGLAVPASAAIPSKAPHPNAARLFMEYITGPQYSQVIRRYFNEPLRPDVPPPEETMPIDKVRLVSPTEAEAEKGVPEVRDQWRDTFGV
jgi:iron(III) transport system substrate-binding protein